MMRIKTIAKKAPMEERKVNLFENSSAAEIKLEEVKKRDKELRKVPLRIDHRTIILVKPTNCNKAYADEVRHKFETGFSHTR
jgi:hypothetical protein